MQAAARQSRATRRRGLWAGNLDPRDHRGIRARVKFLVAPAQNINVCMIPPSAWRLVIALCAHAVNRFAHVEPRISMSIVVVVVAWLLAKFGYEKKKVRFWPGPQQKETHLELKFVVV